MKIREKIRKDFKLEIKDLNDSTGIVAFYFSAPSKDQQNDIILKEAYTKTFKDNFDNFYHNRDHSAACGKPLEVGYDNKGAFCVSQLAIKTVVGLDTYEQYKAGLIKGHSQEFETIKDAVDTVQKARVIKELRLWGVTSVTNIPANLDTPTMSIKSFEEIAGQMRKINEILQKGNISDTLGQSFIDQYLLMKNFIHSNPEMLDNLGIVHCQNCKSIIQNPDESNKCPDCGQFVNVPAKKNFLITDDFIKNIKLF